MDFSAKARPDDPVQSHLAADKKNASGTLSADQTRTLQLVAKYPLQTAKQLDSWFGWNNSGKANRRAPELEAMGLIRRNNSKGGMKLYITSLGWWELERIKDFS